jgi:hypothetical protein
MENILRLNEKAFGCMWTWKIWCEIDFLLPSSRGTNSLGQQGTCDCGACAYSYDAAGYCAPIRTPPSPAAPSEEVIKGLDPFAPPGPMYVNKQVWEQSCECNCAGQGTCKYSPAIGDNDAINQVGDSLRKVPRLNHFSSHFFFCD